MKKLLVLIIVLFVSLSLSAIDTSLTIGYQEKYTIYHEHDPLYISIDIWQDFGDFRIYGNYTNEMRTYERMMFYPSQDYFTVGISYKISIVKVTLEHQCYHPVVAYYEYNGIDGGYTKFQVTIGDRQ